MAEYIELDKILDCLAKDYIERTDNEEALICNVWDKIKKIPTADVVEVRHGEFVRKEDDACWWLECSLCSEPPPKNRYGFYYQSEYCPNCGAKMDGNGEGE